MIAAARKHEADFSRATLSSRVLLEMGLCTCAATGGKKPGVAEFDKLLATVARLIAVAYDSDAMRAGLSGQELSCSQMVSFVLRGNSMNRRCTVTKRPFRGKIEGNIKHPTCTRKTGEPVGPRKMFSTKTSSPLSKTNMAYLFSN